MSDGLFIYRVKSALGGVVQNPSLLTSLKNSSFAHEYHVACLSQNENLVYIGTQNGIQLIDITNI
jgi:hypothetical protein